MGFYFSCYSLCSRLGHVTISNWLACVYVALLLGQRQRNGADRGGRWRNDTTRFAVGKQQQHYYVGGGGGLGRLAGSSLGRLVI